MNMLWLIASAIFILQAEANPKVRVLVYQSLIGKHGLATHLKPAAEKNCRCELEWIPVPAAGQLESQLQRLNAQKDRAPDVVWGSDLAMDRVRETGWAVEEEKTATLLKGVPLRWEGQARFPKGFIPIDMGVTTWVLNKSHPLAPKVLEHVKGREISWAGILALSAEPKWLGWSDPRLSSVGFELLHSMDMKHAKAIRARTRNVASGWSAAYALFMNQEFPLVWSYTTSEAYHLQETPPIRDRIALVLKEGNSVQVEGLWLHRGASTEAVEFVKYLVSKEAQQEIPLHQWMYPARSDVALPESFGALPMPSKVNAVSTQSPSALLQQWEKAL